MSLICLKWLTFLFLLLLKVLERLNGQVQDLDGLAELPQRTRELARIH
jgi:hypothetical protein